MADPKNFSKDMAVILVWVALTVAMIYVPVLNETFLRVIFAVPVILFIPGYVLIAALFPEKNRLTVSNDLLYRLVFRLRWCR